MVFLTADIKRDADELGIDNNSQKKLYRTAKKLNIFFEQEKQIALEMEATESLYGGANNERDEEFERE